jgi:3-hydroxymyristoyl/3-hydroxydecanoyl-(acyl carrier protein) dehydratase
MNHVFLFPLSANDQAGLLSQLETLSQTIDQTDNLPALSRPDRFPKPKNLYTLVIIGRNKTELAQQIDRARLGIVKAFETQGEWKTPLGSYFTARPLGSSRGKVAFVYPGGMNAYVGLGHDLFRLFPKLRDNFAKIVSDVDRAIHPVDNPAAMLEVGTSFAILFTHILRDQFSIQPDMAFGYSMGESSMLWALGVWTDGDTGSQLLREMPLFRSTAVLDKHVVSFALTTTIEAVTAILADEPAVYLTMINTPKELVIAGEPAGCQRVIDRLQAYHVPIPLPLLLHCQPAHAHIGSFVRLFQLPVNPVNGITFYSAFEYAPLQRIDSKTLPHQLAHMMCQPLDFPRLIEQTYTDGARIFIELGAGRTCTRWIGENLAEREHLAVAINKKGLSDEMSITRLLARLMSHGVGSMESQTVATFETAPVLNQPHIDFLRNRQVGLQQLGQLIAWQMNQVRSSVDCATAYHIEQFATGSIAECFGPAYRIYDHRRGPRIPNGEFQFISRVLTAKPQPSANLVAACDLKADGWYFQPLHELGQKSLPYSVYMEIPLQACGFLSVYLGAGLKFPEKDLYFRNLDGQARLFKEITGHQSVISRVRLLSSTIGQGIIIEKYIFALYDEQDDIIIEGETTFGYFDSVALANQVGLAKSSEIFKLSNSVETFAKGQLNLLDKITIQPDGGKYGQGYLLATTKIEPAAWFFACHFYQDPVMPGSLGVEAAFQALQIYIRHLGLSVEGKHLSNHQITWQYRGQITPAHQQMLVELHIKQIETGPAQQVIMADASVWRDDPVKGFMQIYEIVDVALT